MPRRAIEDGCVPPRSHTGRLVPLLLLVAPTVALLAGCSLSTPLCEEGDTLVAAAQPARALEVYARAQAQGDGCAEEGLEIASANQRRAVEEAVRGEAAERAGDVQAATNGYQAALALDVTNALAIAGLARVGQPEPVPPPPVVAQPPDPSWWAGPWPYFLGSVLVSALLTGAVMWFVRTRLSVLEAAVTKSAKRLDVMEQSQQSDQVRLAELQKYMQTVQAQIHALEQDAVARTQARNDALRELKAADAEADRARAKLDRALRLQKERIDHLTELIDLSAQTQAEPTTEAVVWLEPSSTEGDLTNEVTSADKGTNRNAVGLNADGRTSAEDMRVAMNVFAIRTRHGQEFQEQLVIQRVIERGVSLDDVGTEPSARLGTDTSRSEQEPGPFEKAAADNLINPVWQRVEESWWVTPDYRGLADGVNWVKGVEGGWHDLVLGKPAERVALGAGFSPASADVMEEIAAKVRLPGDSLFRSVRRTLQYTGIALGAVSGAAPLANACVSSLAHDLLAEATAKAFRQAISRVLAPVRREIRPIPANELGPDGARAEQLRSHLAAAAPRLRTHEEAQRLERQQRLEREQRLERQPRGPWLDGPSLEP